MNQYNPATILQKERPICPSCHCTFTVSDLGLLHHRSKCPMILNCGHSMCSMCVNNEIRHKGQLGCPVCQKVTSCDILTWKSCPVNYHLIGISHANSALDVDARFNVKFTQTSSYPAVTSSKSIPPSRFCGNCRNADAITKCVECQLLFCQKCFDKEHDEDKKFHDHTTRKIYPPYKRQPPSICEEHGRQNEFFCKVDNTEVCSCCTALGNHKGHDCMEIKTYNANFGDQVRTAVKEAKKVDKCLQHSEKNLKEFSSAVDTRLQKAAIEIRKMFYDFHAILQLREQKLISDMQKDVEARTVSLKQMFDNIEDYRRMILSLVTDSEERLERNDRVIDPNWINELSELKNLPCYSQLSKTTQEAQLDAFVAKPSFDTSFLSKVSCFGEMPNIAEESLFQLVQMKDSPLDVGDTVSEEDEEEDDKDSMPSLEPISPPSDSECSVVTTISTVSKQSVSTNNRKRSQMDPLKILRNLNSLRRNWTKVTSELVITTHIVNPSDFYIRRCSEEKTFEDLQKAIKQWTRKNNKENAMPNSIKLGELYLTYSKRNKCYYRSRVIDISEDVKKVEVFHVDNGDKYKVNFNRILNIPPEMENLPNLAINCSLWQIIPGNKGKGWHRQAIDKFSFYACQGTLLMTVKEVIGDVLHVDLGETMERRGISKVPLSIRESLVFLHYAFYPHASKVPDESHKILNSENESPFPSRFKKPSMPRKGKTLSVLVSHVVSPTLFYIQQNATSLEKVMVDLEEMYGADRDDWELNSPTEGMPCAALYTDGRWYRAEILGLKDDDELEIYYIDFGNKEVVPLKRVRRLLTNFLKSPGLAIECKMADVAPTRTGKRELEEDQGEDGKWSKKAVAYLQGLYGKISQIKVEDILKERILVSLYQVDKNDKGLTELTCCNLELVKLGLATSTGPCSVEKVVVEEEVETTVGPVTPKSFVEVPKSTAIVPSLPRNEKGDLPYMVVHLSCIYSPDLMYAQFVDSEGDLKKVSQILQKTYRGTELDGSPPIWEPLEMCAVLNPDDKLWYRGKIQKPDKDGRVEVFMVDIGETINTKTDQLRMPVGEVFNKPAFAFPCRLVGVVAPGGGKTWPSVAVEYLQELAKKYKTVYLKKMCETTDALMVQMFAKEIRKPEALEPAKETIIWFSDALIDKGMALPAQRQAPAKPIAAAEPVERTAPVEASPKIVTVEFKSSETVVTTSSSPESVPNVLVEKTWKPAEYTFKVGQKLKITPTYVNYSGEIYFHDVDRKDTLDYIKLSLKEKYEGTEPQAHDLYWYAGQMCVAQFQMDLGWHRAKVCKVEDAQITVLFVDYGNEETVNSKQLRKDVILTHIPQQATRCELYNIVPVAEDNKWSEKALNYLHLMIVEKDCNAVVMALPKDQNPKFSVSTIPYQTMEMNMIELKFAKALVKVPDGMLPDAFVIEEDTDEQRAAYKILEPPPFGELFGVVVTEVMEANKFYIQRMNVEGIEPTEYHKEITEHCVQLERHSDWMNGEAESWPHVQEPKEGLVCCAQYLDDSWFRAIVLALDKEEEKISVFYVDFGNTEWITADRIRALPKELLDLPQQAILCQLHQVAPVDEWNEDIMAQFKSIYEGEENLYAIIKDVGPPVQVDLLISSSGPESNSKAELAYQSLIDKNLIKMVIQKKESL